jgi:Flp pilus assembly pilin Flp
MNTPAPPEPLPPGIERQFVNDPVRVAWVVYGFIQAVVTVLMIASVLDEVIGGIITGIVLAGYAAISELFVRPATVPRQPLEELAAAEAMKFPPPPPG